MRSDERLPSDNCRARVIAFYLPQFHPIPENDEWWGPGFTEWTNVVRADPLFRGHRQPRLPTELGFYDLRVPETRAAQAELAAAHGIEAFCYWHYWFGGRRLLERPFEEVLGSGEPDFPFCIGWANQTWTGIWHGAPDKVLVEQTYPGIEDLDAHFDWLLRAFLDPRYVRVEGKPLLIIFRPGQIPDLPALAEHWRRRAADARLPGLFIIGQHSNVSTSPGLDGSLTVQLPSLSRRRPRWKRLLRLALRRPSTYSYDEVLDGFVPPAVPGVRDYPCVFPNWDNTPRGGHRGMVLLDAGPEKFRAVLRRAMDRVADRPFDDRLIFIKSWNEWAEGNFLEPDEEFGRGFLEVIRDEVISAPADLSQRVP